MAGVNYRSTFIAVADDCPVSTGVEPPIKRTPTAARVQFELLAARSYGLTSKDVIFASSTAGRSSADAAGAPYQAARTAFFARPRACLRASPLAKRYGWGLHCDEDGRVALVGVGSDEYERLHHDRSITQLKALRSSRR